MPRSRHSIFLIPLLAAMLMVAVALVGPSGDDPQPIGDVAPVQPPPEELPPLPAAEPPELVDTDQAPEKAAPDAPDAPDAPADPTAPGAEKTRPMCALELRFRDADSGEVLTRPERLWIRAARRGTTRTLGVWYGPGDDEWNPVILPSEFMKLLDGPKGPGELSLALPGYGWVELPAPWNGAKREVEVRAVEPVARGVILPLPGGAEGKVTASIERVWTRPSDRMPARELPALTGSFRLDDLLPGVYRLEVAAEVDGTVIRAKRTFEVGPETVDLGEITLTRYAGIRARVVDADGNPVRQLDVVAVRAEEGPENARILDPGKDGWVEYQDLEPYYNHRVAVLGLPYTLDRIVRTPARFGETTETEFTIPDRLVDCRLRFLRSGHGVLNDSGEPAVLDLDFDQVTSDLPLTRFPWPGGVCHARLLAGTYKFWTEERDPVEATLTILQQEEFEAEVLFPTK